MIGDEDLGEITGLPYRRGFVLTTLAVVPRQMFAEGVREPPWGRCALVAPEPSFNCRRGGHRRRRCGDRITSHLDVVEDLDDVYDLLTG